MWVQFQKIIKKTKKGVLVGYEGSLIYYIWLLYTQRVVRLFLITFIENLLLFKLIIGIYIEMILFNYVINNIDLKLNNFEKSISGIGFRGIIVFVLGIKYH